LDDVLLTSLVACETKVWDALVAGDQAADAAALHPAFLGVYSDGFATKADHVAQLAQGPTIQSYVMTGCQVMALGADYAVLSYRAEFMRNGREVPEAMYVSSIWKRRARDWLNVFSQDTPATALPAL
jgi:hypothetical protein